MNPDQNQEPATEITEDTESRTSQADWYSRLAIHEGQTMLAVIGGSGVYDIEGLANKRWVKVESAFGAPSDELLFAELNGQPLAFLPRHGRGHQIPPSEINFHANIDAPVAFQLDADPGLAAAQRGGIGFRQRIA